jgi:integrase
MSELNIQKDNTVFDLNIDQDVIYYIVNYPTQPQGWTLPTIKSVATNLKTLYGISTITALNWIVTTLDYQNIPIIIHGKNTIRNLVKRFRETTYRASSNEMRWIDITESMYDFLWSHWMNSDTPKDNLLLPLYATLTRDGGFGRPLFPTILARLRLCDFIDDQSLVFPLGYLDKSDSCCQIAIPNSSKLILCRLLRGRYKEPHDNYILYSKAKLLTNRKTVLLKQINLQYTQFATAYTNTTGVKTPSLHEFSNILRLLSLDKNMPPYLYTILSRSPLPATGKWHEHISFIRKRSLARPTERKSSKTKILIAQGNTKAQYQEEGSTLNDMQMAKPGWRHRAIRILSAYIEKIRSLNADGFKSPGVREKVIAITNEYITLANSFTKSKSALHLALQWCQYKMLVEDVNSSSSLPTYTSHVFNSGLFANPYANYLPNIPPEEHNAIIRARLTLRPHTEYKNIKEITNTWFNVYKFAANNGYIENAVLEVVIKDIDFAKRTIQLGPGDFDTTILPWKKSRNFYLEMLAFFIEIAFYTGMRGSEILNLQLRDIVTGTDYLDILIRKGKTDNARRTIPYHILAPQHAVNDLQSYYSKRLVGYERGSNASLFGPPHHHLHYDAKSFFKALSDGLNSIFDQTITPHYLRHAFANTVILRTALISNPDLLKIISDNDHPIYNASSIEKLREWTNSVNNRGDLGCDNTLLWHAAKLIGHSTPEQTIYTYCHSHSYIQQFYTSKINEIIGERKLSTNAVAALVPNMRSSRTRARKLRGKITLNEAIKLALKNI